MANRIILLSGATGVGTSSFSFELAKLLHIPTVIGTDAVREVLRSTLQPEINPALMTSTYLVGQTEHYESKSEETKKAEIIRGYKMQSHPISVGVEGVIKRAVKENVPLIAEGVHIIPGKFRDSDRYIENQGRFLECHLFIEDPELHKQRFIKRSIDAPKRSLDHYLSNFQEIRWIHDYLTDKARAKNILLVENSLPLEEGVKRIIKEYYS